jgi:protein-tyrosine phosphatase
MTENFCIVNSLCQVDENIYIGDKKSARRKCELQDLGISAIVNCTVEQKQGGLSNYFEKDDNFSYFRVPVKDSDQTQICPFFDSACRYIDNALNSGHKVLVHCQQVRLKESLQKFLSSAIFF